MLDNIKDDSKIIHKLKQQIAKKEKELKELRYKNNLLWQELALIEFDKLNPLSPYKWYNTKGGKIWVSTILVTMRS